MAEEEQLLADARQSTSEETSPSGRSRRLAWAAVPLALLAVGGLATNQAAKRTEQALPPEPQVHRIPDFGSDTQAVESILARVGCYYENDLDRLSVNYQGIHVDDHIFNTHYDATWLKREPLVSWGNLMSGPDDDTKYTVAVFDADAHSGVLGKTHGNFLHALWTDCEGGSNIACAAPGKAKASYVPPMPPSDQYPHMYIFVLFKQPPYVDEVRFDNRHVNGGQAWRRNNRVKEIIQNNPLLEPVAVNYMRVDGVDPKRPWEAWEKTGEDDETR